MAKDFGMQMGLDVCKALGLDPDTVRSIDIHLEPTALSMSVTTSFIDKAQAVELTRIFDGVSWREREEVGDANP